MLHYLTENAVFGAVDGIYAHLRGTHPLGTSNALPETPSRRPPDWEAAWLQADISGWHVAFVKHHVENTKRPRSGWILTVRETLPRRLWKLPVSSESCGNHQATKCKFHVTNAALLVYAAILNFRHRFQYR